jgi:hypothetical protein
VCASKKWQVVTKNFVLQALHFQKTGRGVHVTGVSAAYTFKLNKNILSE